MSRVISFGVATDCRYRGCEHWRLTLLGAFGLGLTQALIASITVGAKSAFGSLRIHPYDAGSLVCEDGDWVRISSKRGKSEAPVELTDELQPGHFPLPNGHGFDYQNVDGTHDRRGISRNELTNTADRDFLAGTPWHK